ncbi:uncharacterized protein LOC134691592 [Mytilus trossulus]|uniref:uncharacterized protein LOC134691592 n=1 Tax=Mytilus trossulus TaxID=6551 RepID=UPI0030057DA7
MIEGEGDHNCSSGNEAEMFGEMLMRHKLEAMAYKKPKPGTFCKYQTEDRLIKTERMKKTRLIKELTRIGGKLKTHNKEPVECLFIIKNKSTNRFKYVGFGDVCEKFESGLPITKHISKCRKYTFPEQGYFPNTEEVNKDIEQLTPNKYSFGFIDTGNQQSTSSNMTLCELQKKRINSMEINDLETINIKRKRELFSQKARGKGARGGGRQQFREISSDSESQSDGAVNKRLKKANRGRGRGRGAPKGKGRGKTSQRRTTEANAPEQQEEKDLSDEIPIIIHERKRNNVPKAGTSNDHDDSLNVHSSFSS